MKKNKVNVKVQGLDKLQKEINKKIAKVNTFTPEALDDIRLDLEGKSKDRAPVDKGDLKGSGFSEREGLTAVVGFTEPYALRQHEELRYNHPRGGEAKYLENPYKENKNKYIKHLADSTRRAVE